MPTLLLGVAGGIAAYKVADLASALRQRGWDVHVVMTEAATRFVSPLTFGAVTRNPVHVDPWAMTADGQIDHIELAKRADVFLVAPATANVLAKLAAGLADDLLTTSALATEAPLVLAPAMNPKMWSHPATQANLATLVGRGATLVSPEAGEMACGDIGDGRLPTREVLIAAVEARLAARHDLAGKRVIVTAGGTREALDAVRYLGNRSSGKMGHAIAAAAAARGAEVTLVTTRPEVPAGGASVVAVESAAQMRDAVLARYGDAHVVVMAAAVADYRPEAAQGDKRKKDGQPWTVTFVPNPDILAELGATKVGQYLVGFAAETGDPRAAAAEKLVRKRADLIVANDVAEPGQGFGSDSNRVAVVGSEGVIAAWGPLPKVVIADHLWTLVATRLSIQPGGG